MRGPVRAYFRDLSKLVREVSEDIAKTMGRSLERWTEEEQQQDRAEEEGSRAVEAINSRDSLTTADAFEEELERMAEELRRKYTSPRALGGYRESAQDAAGRTSAVNRMQVTQQLTKLGLNVLRESPVTERFLRRSARANTGLITTIPQELIADSVRIIEEGVLSGQRHEQIAKQLFAIRELDGQPSSATRKALNRAKLIARDQTLTLSGQLTKTRHRANGVRKFIWNTVGDGRVRDLHVPRNGKEYTWKDGAPGGEPFPGSGINCRCFAEPVL